jgi:NhaP-type Na+/H+ or K+/H+ antiporter
MGRFIGLISLVCCVWVIYDVWEHQKQMDKSQKILWTVLAVLFNVVTAVVYYLLIKRK